MRRWVTPLGRPVRVGELDLVSVAQSMGEWPGDSVIFFRRVVGRVEAVAGVERLEEGRGAGLRREDAMDGGGISPPPVGRGGGGMRLLGGPRLGIGARREEDVEDVLRCGGRGVCFGRGGGGGMNDAGEDTAGGFMAEDEGGATLVEGWPVPIVAALGWRGGRMKVLQAVGVVGSSSSSSSSSFSRRVSTSSGVISFSGELDKSFSRFTASHPLGASCRPSCFSGTSCLIGVCCCPRYDRHRGHHVFNCVL
jgi:hypothetical protein